MNAQTQRTHLFGQAGNIEALLDNPLSGEKAKGVAIIAHPHPLFGGSMDNKVVQTMARAFVQSGWQAVRFNFRGVGGSQGSYSEGLGETEDFLDVVKQCAPSQALALAGFSFGSYVVSQALLSLWPHRVIEKLVLVGTAVSRFKVAQVPQELHERTLVIHGESDDTVALSDIMNWARPQSLPVTVIPGGSHFFHGQLPLLKNLVVRHLYC